MYGAFLNCVLTHLPFHYPEYRWKPQIMCVYVYVCVREYVYVCLNVCICVYVYVCVCVCVFFPKHPHQIWSPPTGDHFPKDQAAGP